MGLALDAVENIVFIGFVVIAKPTHCLEHAIIQDS